MGNRQGTTATPCQGQSKMGNLYIPANEMIFHACAVFLTRYGVRFRLRTIEYAALNLPCLVPKILAHPTENHFVRGYNSKNGDSPRALNP